MIDLAKALVVLLAYGVFAPALGAAIARHRNGQRLCLCLMLFMTSWHPSKLTLMLDSIEMYRGHTRGFQFCIIEVVALALILSAGRCRPPRFPWRPPGTWLWLGYCALSMVSIIPALDKVYVLMAMVKFSKIILIYIAAYHALRDEKDLRWLFHTIAGMLILQALVALKMRYLDGRWQISGWFEHQNPLAMWSYVCSLPLLSAALAPQTSKRDTLVYLAGVAAAALLILLTVSRAGLAAFAIGSVAVVGLAALRGLSVKVAAVATAGVVGAVAASMVAMGSFHARMAEVEEHKTDMDLRAILIVQCKAMLRDSPLGVGWNNYGLANSRPRGRYSWILEEWDEGRGFTVYDENYYENPLTESLYWLILSETGYPGYVGFVMFLAATVWWGFRCTFRFWRSPAGYFAGSLLVVLVILYLHGTVERVLTQTKNLSEWLIFAGCLARIEMCRRRGRDLEAEDNKT